MRKTKWNFIIVASVLALTILGARATAAPGAAKPEQSEQAAKKETSQDSNIYRVSYRVDELENGKTINSRSYTLMAQAGNRAMARIGSKVPYSVGGDHFQWQDVYMRIDSTVKEQEGRLQVQTGLDMSLIAGKETIPSGESRPVFGQVTLQDVTSATLGRPAFVGSVEDVASNRHYEIHVTVTRAD